MGMRCLRCGEKTEMNGLYIEICDACGLTIKSSIVSQLIGYNVISYGNWKLGFIVVPKGSLLVLNGE